MATKDDRHRGESNEPETSGEAWETNRREFMLLSGLATGGLLSSAGVAGATGVGPGGGRTSVAGSVPDVPIDRAVEVNLFYPDGIQGDSQIESREGSSDLLGLDWGFDLATDAPRGRHLAAVIVAKPIDNASVSLYDNYIGGTVLTPYTLRFYRVNQDDGTVYDYFRVGLENTVVLRMETVTTVSGGGPLHVEVITLGTEAVTIENLETGESTEIRERRRRR